MPRILIAECRQEVSSFNPVASRYEDFRILKGADLLELHRGLGEAVGGALQVFDTDPDVVLVPTYAAISNTSGGVLDAESLARLRDEFVAAVAAAGRVDAAYFSLHGAMQAVGEEDPEGLLLQEARQLLGEQIPFVVSVDLHGIVTDRMLVHSDVIVPYHTYPHVDFHETGARAARALLRILRGARPVTARVKIPALVRGDELITETGAVGVAINRARRIEAAEGGLSAGVTWGNPFTDVPELRSNSFVVLDDDVETASRLAVELADLFWEHHDKMQVPLVPLADAVGIAGTVTDGTVIMVDAADATSSGAVGDSNAIAREALRQGYGGSILAPLVDPGAVEAAFAAGVGATFRTALGGALDPARHTPLQLTVTVRSLSDGRFRSESFGRHWDSGPTAVLESSGSITFVVGTRPVSLYDRSWFWANGQDPKRFDLVVVKSPHCEPHMFSDWCARQIDVDAPGSTSANLASLGHSRCARPLFPLDGAVGFTPVADIFQRPG
jgi:microcystin degradation protein MlrC